MKKDEINRMCIYLTYDKDNIVDRYISYILKELKKCVSYLVVVCNELEVIYDKNILESYANQIIYRGNIGFDAGGFKDALCNYIGWDKIYEYDELVLVNDSFFGPFRPLEDIFEEMDKQDVDFWGLIKHGERKDKKLFYTPEHIQSFFIVVRRNMLHSKEYRDYWEQLPYFKTFIDTVRNYEVKMTSHFKELGFQYAVLANTEVNDSNNLKNNIVQYSALSYELMDKRNFPFFKKQQIAYNTLDLQTQENVKKSLDYIEQHTEYDVNLIWENVIRTMDISDIYRSFHLRYLISDKTTEEEIGVNSVIVVYVSYIEALEYLLPYLNPLQENWNILIISEYKNILDEYKKYGFKVILIEKNPWDIWKILKEYEYVCYLIDTDITADFSPSCTGKSYLYNIWENLLKSEIYIKKVLGLFKKDNKLGYLASPQPIHAEFFCELDNGWNGEFEVIRYLLEESGLHCVISEDKPPFSHSESFWIRGEIIHRALKMKNKSQVLEKLPYLWVYIAQDRGYYSGILESTEYASMNEINMQEYLKEIIYQVKQEYGNFENFLGMKKRIFEGALSLFCKKNREIMIYGAGEMAKKYQDVLPNIRGFIVTDGQPKEEKINGLPVLYLSEVNITEDIGIIVCMLKKYQVQVTSLLEEKGIYNYLCI